jgi:hypothetical protein
MTGGRCRIRWFTRSLRGFLHIGTHSTVAGYVLRLTGDRSSVAGAMREELDPFIGPSI